MLLTRTEFNQACICFIANKSSHSADDLLSRNLDGWQWHEHSTCHGHGYLARVGTAARRSSQISISEQDLIEEPLEDDISTLSPNPSTHQLLTVHQYIAYSPTFQVPTFYFTVHDSDGSLLTIKEIINSTLFHSHALPQDVDVAPHSISLPASNFPLLSQGDHPVLGTPCWYFHPCETSSAVVELLEAGPKEHQTEDQKWLRWLEVWFLMLSSVVDLRWHATS